MSRVEELPTSSDSDDDQPTPSVATAASPSGTGKSLNSTDEDTPSARCARLKLEGNSLFSNGNIEGALERYMLALQDAERRPRPPPQTHAPDAAPPLNEEKDKQADVPVPVETDPVKEEHYILTAQIMCNTAACLMKQSKYAEAELHLTDAIHNYPQYERAFQRRADCYYALEKWSSAHADWETLATKFHTKFDRDTIAKRDHAKAKTDEEMQKMLGQLKDLGNMFLGKFGLSTDNFKFDKDPSSGNYSMRFEK